MGERRSRLGRRNGLRWFGAVSAPWTAGLGFLVALTASVGTNAGVPTAFDAGHAPLAGSARGSNDTAGRIQGALPRANELPERGDTPGTTLADSDGSTPAIPRAVALASVTPAPADAVPVEVAAASLALPGFSPRLDRGTGPALAPDAAGAGRPRYADLIDPERMDREHRCLAEAVYFEARSESEEGQAAVAQVVLNRVGSGLYPANVCGVVYQNRHRYMGCQFSFACEGKALHITDNAAWAGATRVASAVIEGRTYLDEVGGATHYHANYVRPGWSRRLKRMDVIGRHIFYGLKPGQT